MAGEPLAARVAGLVHDVNNTLQTVLLCHDLIGKDATELLDLPDEQLTLERVRAALTKILERSTAGAVAARRCASFGRKALPLAKELMLPTSHLEELNAVIHEAAMEARVWLQATHPAIELDVHVTPTKLWTAVNRDDFVGALDNLVRNAAEAMPTGGKITIAALLQDEGKMVCVQVRDEGTGVDEAVLPRMWEPGFTTKAKGNGMGLYGVKTFADAHGGRVTVTSAPGAGGTVMEICVPRVLDAK